MRKTARKLKLESETLRHLSRAGLDGARAAAAARSVACTFSCPAPCSRDAPASCAGCVAP